MGRRGGSQPEFPPPGPPEERKPWTGRDWFGFVWRTALVLLGLAFAIWFGGVQCGQSKCHRACRAAGHASAQYTIDGCECLDKAGPPPNWSD